MLMLSRCLVLGFLPEQVPQQEPLALFQESLQAVRGLLFAALQAKYPLVGQPLAAVWCHPS